MNFNTTSGVYSASPAQSTPRPAICSSHSLPASFGAGDLICTFLLLGEIALLVIFSDALFYGILLPALDFLLNISGVLLLLAGIGAAVRRLFFHRRRRWF